VWLGDRKGPSPGSIGQLAAGKPHKTNFFSIEETEKWMEDHEAGDTAVAWEQVEDAETTFQHNPEDMRNAENAGSTTTKPEMTFEEMLNALGNSLSALGSCENGEDGEDEDDDNDVPPPGKLSEDDTPSWAMGTISNTVQHRMESF
jgi:hypothetical protein